MTNIKHPRHSDIPTSTEIRAVQEEVALHRQRCWGGGAGQGSSWQVEGIKVGGRGGREDSNEDVKIEKGRKRLNAQELGLARVSYA